MLSENWADVPQWTKTLAHFANLVNLQERPKGWFIVISLEQRNITKKRWLKFETHIDERNKQRAIDTLKYFILNKRIIARDVKLWFESPLYVEPIYIKGV